MQTTPFTIGFIFTYCCGAVVYLFKTQSITAISSTVAEFLVVVSCAKIILYLQSFLFELDSATPINKDNTSTITIVNSQILSTESSRHI